LKDLVGKTIKILTFNDMGKIGIRKECAILDIIDDFIRIQEKNRNPERIPIRLIVRIEE